MGMTLDYKLVLPLVPCAARDEKLVVNNETNSKTLMAFSYPPITLSKEDQEKREHISGFIEMEKKPNFQIIFEHTPLSPGELSEVF
jgi:hypothetical protein